MPFTKETASRAGKKSKRGKDVLDSELKKSLNYDSSTSWNQ